MKLLIISDAWHPQVNGVVRTYEYLAKHLRAAGHEVKIIGPRDFRHRMALPGYAEIDFALFSHRPLSRIIEEYQPDCVHLATEGALGHAGRRYCLKHSVRFTTSYHTHFPDYFAKRVAKFLPLLYKPAHRLARTFIHNFHKPSSKVMIATESLERDLRARGFKMPMGLVTRGVEMDEFYPAPKSLFKDLKAPIALYVGRVAIEKNIQDFLDMPWEGSKVIVGDGPSRQALEGQYPKAVFTGKKMGTDLAKHYQSADLFVFPSRTDTFGIVLIEALSSGLPVAGYPVAGPIDIITDNILGALDDDLGKAAAKALSCGTAEERAAFVKDRYSWAFAAKQFTTLIQS